MNRRTLLKSLAIAGPMLAFLPRLAQAALTALGAEEPLAKALRYTPDAAKSADPARSDKKAFCSNCVKYNKCSPADAGCKPAAKTANEAPCEIFAGKTVAKTGWCLSWSKT